MSLSRARKLQIARLNLCCGFWGLGGLKFMLSRVQKALGLRVLELLGLEASLGLSEVKGFVVRGLKSVEHLQVLSFGAGRERFPASKLMQTY